MNKQFAISVVVLFVVSMLLGFVVHGFLLGGDYARLVPGMFRTPEDGHAHFPYMVAANVLMAIGYTWIYRQGRDDRPWLGQGLRFGAAVAVLATIPTYLIYFAVQPMPSDVVAKQIVLDTIAVLILGVVTAALNRAGASAPRPA